MLSKELADWECLVGGMEFYWVGLLHRWWCVFCGQGLQGAYFLGIFGEKEERGAIW
jgi:hypothetical protein